MERQINIYSNISTLVQIGPPGYMKPHLFVDLDWSMAVENIKIVFGKHYKHCCNLCRFLVYFSSYFWIILPLHLNFL